MRENHATFANLIVHFGDNDLIDYLHEIVLPAFTDTSQTRSYGEDTVYRFYQVEVFKLRAAKRQTVYAISGRFIKDTTLSRTQVFEPQKGLLASHRTMKSAPSAYFVLMLDNHRLIYLPETPHAPELSPFAATITHFLKSKYRAFIDSEYGRLNDAGERTTKTELRAQHNPPVVSLVPLTSSEDIASFVARYKQLRRLELDLIKPNADIDGSDMFRSFREYMETAQPKTTKVVAANPKGLNAASAVKIIQDATAGGNQEVKLSGLDEDGNELKGNNDHFKVTKEIDQVPANLNDRAQKLLDVFLGLVGDGTIRLEDIDQQTAQNITNILRRLG